jgi:uncharacterized protein (DUF1800 family)
MRVSLKGLICLLFVLIAPVSIQVASGQMSPVATQVPGSATTGTAVNGQATAESVSEEFGPSGQAVAETVAPQQISPKTVFVHLGQVQLFVSAGATVWSASEGKITNGYFVAPATMPSSSKVSVIAKGPGGTATATVSLVGGPFQTISPSGVTLALGATKQFTSPGATTWSVTYGTITSTGLYTAPATWPPSGTAVIAVSGSHGSGKAEIVFIPPTPTITNAGSYGHIPLGLFSIGIAGTGFIPQSRAKLNGIPLSVTYSNGTLRAAGFYKNTGPATLTVINGSIVSAPFAAYVGVKNPKVTPAAARRFLEQAAFGPSPTEAENVQAVGLAAWIQQQFKVTPCSSYKDIRTNQGGMPQQFLTNAVNCPDQLRQRVAFALSQIFVTSIDKIVWNPNMISYQDMLLGDAFSNYRQIMGDVTLSPAMGQYLDMANNAKADPSTGSAANENYARELMQLFTLGTNMLNVDGTVQLDSNNLPLPTYSQFTVTEFARVYTGWTYTPKPGRAVYWNAGVTSYGSLVTYSPEHDTGSKQLLNGYVSPAGLSAKQDLNNALDNIFKHPNICPFVSTLLIQHLVKSNPSPAYVQRVAAVFANNGSGVRGDMKAVITAILMDQEARANDNGGNAQPADGHLQEPVLYIAGVIRAFGGKMNDQNYYSWVIPPQGQNLFSPPSVFNYYAPNYGVPGTSLMGGEFQIYTPNNAILRANMISDLFRQYSDPVQTFGPGTAVDLSAFVQMASNPAGLVSALDLTLTHGTMPSAMKSTIVTAVTGETGGNLRRVQKAVYLILSSSYYNVWH